MPSCALRTSISTLALLSLGGGCRDDSEASAPMMRASAICEEDPQHADIDAGSWGSADAVADASGGDGSHPFDEGPTAPLVPAARVTGATADGDVRSRRA